MKFRFISNSYHKQRAASAVELAIILSLLVLALWYPLKLIVANFQGDAVIIQQIDTAYQSLAGQSFPVSEMAPNAYLRRRSNPAEIRAALRGLSSQLYQMSDVDGFCSVALEADSGGVREFDHRDRNNNPCPGFSGIPPKVQAAFQASINPYAGRQYAVAAYNENPNLDQEFALYRASTLPNSQQ